MMKHEKMVVFFKVLLVQIAVALSICSLIFNGTKTITC